MQEKYQILTTQTICSYNTRQQDAQILKFISYITLNISDSSTFHYQEYLNTVHKQ